MINHSYNIQDFNNLLSQYQVIGDLSEGQKLTINKTTENLEISYGSNTSYVGSLFQKVGRAVENYTVYDTNWSHVAKHIEKLNTKASELLDYYATHEGIQEENKNLLKEKIIKAAGKLRTLGEVSYESRKEAKDKFLLLSENVRLLAEQKFSSYDALLIDPLMLDNFVKLADPSEHFAALSRQQENFLKEEILQKQQLTELSDNSVNFINEKELSSIDESYFTLIDDKQQSISEDFSYFQSIFFNPDQAKELIAKMEQEFKQVALSDKTLRQEQLATISELLVGMNEDQLDKKQQLITDLVTLSFYPPLMANGTGLNLLSFDRLKECIIQMKHNPEVVLNQLDTRYFNEKNTSSQKIYLLSHLNFVNQTVLQQIKTSKIYDPLYHSPALSLFLMNARIHVPQTYRQTCIGTVHNLWFQRQCGTVLEMLMISKEAVQVTMNKFNQLSNTERQAPAYEVISGQAPTTEDYVRQVLVTIMERIESLESKVLSTTLTQHPSSQAIAQLTREWNFMMQDIDTILDPKKPRVYSYQYLPDYYYTSAVLSAVLTQTGQFIPGSPKANDRWKALSQANLQKLGETFFGEQTKSYVYRHGYQDEKAGPELHQVQIDRIWQTVNEQNGCFIDFNFLTKGSGHTIFVAAGFDEQQGAKVFDIYDPMVNQSKRVNLKEFKQFINESYEKPKVTNAMYTYKIKHLMPSV